MVAASVRYRQRKRSWSSFFSQLAVDVVAALMGGLLFMLAVGIIHHEWIPNCPTIGYGWSVALSALIRGALFLNRLPKENS